MKTSNIQIRDPFVFPHPTEKVYYLFGTTDKNCWRGPGQGFDCYRSQDLSEWEGPFPAFRPTGSFWGKENFWAPEVHFLNGLYFMFATFKADHRYRGTQILVSDQVKGPYIPLTDAPVTPPDWQCLDGTLFVEADNTPWLVFCHEWVQIHNGAVYAIQLAADLRKPAGRPVFLFNASEAPWVHPLKREKVDFKYQFPNYVTDGPSLYRLKDGTLLMLWSSFSTQRYAMGIARSETGHITGPWRQDHTPLWSEDGGHGMIFKTFDQRLMLTFHRPNTTPQERAVFIELEEAQGNIFIKG